jgi:hypothetical protein
MIQTSFGHELHYTKWKIRWVAIPLGCKYAQQIPFHRKEESRWTMKRHEQNGAWHPGRRLQNGKTAELTYRWHKSMHSIFHYKGRKQVDDEET